MLNKEIFGNGFIRCNAAPDMHDVQRVYITWCDGRNIVALTPGEIRAMALAFGLLVDDMDAGLAGVEAKQPMTAERTDAARAALDEIGAVTARAMDEITAIVTRIGA